MGVVVVGANNERLGDPLFPVIKCDASDAQVLLVEPHPYLTPHLRRNYAFLPKDAIFQQRGGITGAGAAFLSSAGILRTSRSALSGRGLVALSCTSERDIGQTQLRRGRVRRVGKEEVGPAHAVGKIGVVELAARGRTGRLPCLPLG
ncbi:hypothetical protein ILP92_16615 [Maribius pontilimi]|uniref:Uncharacterized protein n=1 Tax=Palleronia pontilimi TaxID=1964209 RepID=A0A934IJA9_9RHOB|nr:hypothetical protein [Palleronia pontilimi]MBJ3764365.1 hypothetical protein [Palleronia pontilimi]